MLAQLPDIGGAAQPLLSVRGLSKTFGARGGLWRKPAPGVAAVDGISFDLFKGETLGLVGESGCGKSTLSRMLMAILEPSSGEIIFDGQVPGSRDLPMKSFRRAVQMVFQDSFASLNPRVTVGEALSFAPEVHGMARAEARKRADGLLDAVGLSARLYRDRYPHELSGGQRQRVNIARALSVSPRLLILDEPVSALDKSVEAQVLNLLVDLKAEFGLTYIFISHDLNVVQYLSDRMMVMYRGRIMETGDVNTIYHAPGHPYTRTLLASRAGREGRGLRARMPAASGAPEGAELPGCRYRSRCGYADAICASGDPVLGEIRPGHQAACFMSHRHSQALPFAEVAQ